MKEQVRYSSAQSEIEISMLRVLNWHKNFQGTYSFSVLYKYSIGSFFKRNSHKVESIRKGNLLSCHYSDKTMLKSYSRSFQISLCSYLILHSCEVWIQLWIHIFIYAITLYMLIYKLILYFEMMTWTNVHIVKELAHHFWRLIISSSYECTIFNQYPFDGHLGALYFFTVINDNVMWMFTCAPCILR